MEFNITRLHLQCQCAIAKATPPKKWLKSETGIRFHREVPLLSQISDFSWNTSYTRGGQFLHYKLHQSVKPFQYITGVWWIVTHRERKVPIQLARCWFAELAISNAEILIYFSNKIHRSNLSNSTRNSYGFKLPECRLQVNKKILLSFSITFGRLVPY